MVDKVVGALTIEAIMALRKAVRDASKSSGGQHSDHKPDSRRQAAPAGSRAKAKASRAKQKRRQADNRRKARQ